MTDEELTAIERRANAATREPWIVGDAYVPAILSAVSVYGMGMEVAECQMVRDGEFIAHARVDVPALVAEVRTLRAERDADPASHDALIIAEGQRDQARAERDALRDQWSGLLIEQARLVAQRDDAIAERDALRKVDVATVIRFLVGYTQYEDNYSTDFSHSAAVRAGLTAALAVQP
jgi:hypothetical protein